MVAQKLNPMSKDAILALLKKESLDMQILTQQNSPLV